MNQSVKMDEAINKIYVPKILEELSTEEFQQKLYVWFKENGLMADLKSYLRYQMINKLRGTNLGQTISNSPSNTSPKIQAINLLIADYLLHNRFHYTLSIFSSEVPLPTSIHELPVCQNLNSSVIKNVNVFKQRDITDILDALGFGHDTIEGEYILKDYESNPQEPLLTRIVRCLSRTREIESLDNIEELQDPNIDINMVRWLTYINKILIKSKVKGTQLKFLKKHVNILFKSELERIKMEQESKYKTIIEEKDQFIQTNMKKKEDAFKNKLRQYEDKIKQYKNSVSNELKAKQDHLEELAKQLQDQHARVTENIFEVQHRFQELDVKEQQLKQSYEQKSHEIYNLQLDIEHRSEMLDEREKIITNLQSILETNHDSIKTALNDQIHEVESLKKQCMSLKQELEQTKSTVKSHIEEETNTTNTSNQTEIAQLKEMYGSVQNENSVLKTEIQNLTNCLDKLNRDLRVRPQLPVENFFGRRDEPLISDEPQVPIRRRGPRLTRQLGGGEEALLHDRSIHVSRFQSYTRDSRKKVFHKSSDSPSSSDTSPTDEIVRDARNRLRKLKKESDSIERQCRKFRARSPVKVANDVQVARDEIMKNIEATNMYVPVFGRKNFTDVINRIRERTSANPTLEKFDFGMFKESNEVDDASTSCKIENSVDDSKIKKVSFNETVDIDDDSRYLLHDEHFFVLDPNKLNSKVKFNSPISVSSAQNSTDSFHGIDRPHLSIENLNDDEPVNSSKTCFEENKDMDVLSSRDQQNTSDIKQPTRSTGAIRKRYVQQSPSSSKDVVKTETIHRPDKVQKDVSTSTSVTGDFPLFKSNNLIPCDSEQNNGLDKEIVLQSTKGTSQLMESQNEPVLNNIDISEHIEKLKNSLIEIGSISEKIDLSNIVKSSSGEAIAEPTRMKIKCTRSISFENSDKSIELQNESLHLVELDPQPNMNHIDEVPNPVSLEMDLVPLENPSSQIDETLLENQNVGTRNLYEILGEIKKTIDETDANLAKCNESTSVVDFLRLSDSSSGPDTGDDEMSVGFDSSTKDFWD